MLLWKSPFIQCNVLCETKAATASDTFVFFFVEHLTPYLIVIVSIHTIPVQNSIRLPEERQRQTLTWTAHMLYAFISIKSLKALSVHNINEDENAFGHRTAHNTHINTVSIRDGEEIETTQRKKLCWYAKIPFQTFGLLYIFLKKKRRQEKKNEQQTDFSSRQVLFKGWVYYMLLVYFSCFFLWNLIHTFAWDLTFRELSTVIDMFVL